MHIIRLPEVRRQPSGPRRPPRNPPPSDRLNFLYQATNRTETEQLAALSRIIGTHFDDAALLRGVALPDWESLFQYLTDRAAGAPLLLVLDEFPYLAAAAPALPSIIQEDGTTTGPGRA